MSDTGDFKARDWSVHPPYLLESYKSTVLRSPTKPLVPLAQTLSELTGPVYGHDELGPLDDNLTDRKSVV
jgi:protocatechuate 3,4-dioxygenase beta subunit